MLEGIYPSSKRQPFCAIVKKQVPNCTNNALTFFFTIICPIVKSRTAKKAQSTTRTTRKLSANIYKINNQ